MCCGLEAIPSASIRITRSMSYLPGTFETICLYMQKKCALPAKKMLSYLYHYIAHDHIDLPDQMLSLHLNEECKALHCSPNLKSENRFSRTVSSRLINILMQGLFVGEICNNWTSWRSELASARSADNIACEDVAFHHISNLYSQTEISEFDYIE